MVNPVNARLIAKERGIEIIESKARAVNSGAHAGAMTVRVNGRSENSAAGALFASGQGPNR